MYIKGNIKNNLKFVEKRLKDVRKMCLGDLRIVMFYGQFNKLYKIYYYHIFKIQFQRTARKQNQLGSSNFSWILGDVPRTSVLEVIQNTLLIYCFRFYSLIVLLTVVYSYSFEETSCRDPQNVPKICLQGNVQGTSILDFLYKYIFIALLSISVYQICA